MIVVLIVVLGLVWLLCGFAARSMFKYEMWMRYCVNGNLKDDWWGLADEIIISVFFTLMGLISLLIVIVCQLTFGKDFGSVISSGKTYWGLKL